MWPVRVVPGVQRSDTRGIRAAPATDISNPSPVIPLDLCGSSLGRFAFEMVEKSLPVDVDKDPTAVLDAVISTGRRRVRLATIEPAGQ